MKRTLLLQELRQIRFEQAWQGWSEGRLDQFGVAQILGMGKRSFRRFVKESFFNHRLGSVDTISKLQR